MLMHHRSDPAMPREVAPLEYYTTLDDPTEEPEEMFGLFGWLLLAFCALASILLEHDGTHVLTKIIMVAGILGVALVITGIVHRHMLSPD